MKGIWALIGRNNSAFLAESLFKEGLWEADDKPLFYPHSHPSFLSALAVRMEAVDERFKQVLKHYIDIYEAAVESIIPQIRCFDSPKCGDRYTVVYIDQPEGGGYDVVACVSTSAYPFHPQGIGQHSSARYYPGGLNSHLGVPIEFRELPDDCQRLVLNDLLQNPCQ